MSTWKIAFYIEVLQIFVGKYAGLVVCDLRMND
jgi:hypothetical protein